jgi:hypothetical protein
MSVPHRAACRQWFRWFGVSLAICLGSGGLAVVVGGIAFSFSLAFTTNTSVAERADVGLGILGNALGYGFLAAYILFVIVLNLLEGEYLKQQHKPTRGWVLLGIVGWFVLMPIVGWLNSNLFGHTFRHSASLTIGVGVLLTGALRTLILRKRFASIMPWAFVNAAATIVILCAGTLLFEG